MATNLHPVKWAVERLSPSGFYAYGFGGGLAEAVRTDGFDTEAEALAELRRLLAPRGRRPDPSLCNVRTEKGAEWLRILS